MPSPDATPYIDLELVDKDPQEVFDAAITLLGIRMPNWTPREGNTEVLLLEALAQEVADLIFATNRVPNAVVEALIRLYGITRDAGAPPTVSLTFYMAGTQGYTIPVGTLVRLDLPGGLEPVVFATDEELVILDGVDNGTVTATGDRYTTDANGVVAGTVLEVLDSVVYVESVETASVVADGRDAETDDDYFTRGTQRFYRLTDTLVLPAHFTASALEHVYVERATTLDNYNPGGDLDNNGPVGVDTGHVTVAVYGDGAVVSAPNKAALEAEMEAACLSSLDVHIIDPTITTVAVTVQVKKYSTYESATVQANVVAALQDYLNPATWDWGGTVRRNELIHVISNVDGVDYVDSLTAPAADTALSGVAPLANAGVLTVTVV